MICDHLADLGRKVEYGPGRHGPGRHGPGHNFFVYVRNPSSGLRLELYSDMAHIHDEATYTPPRWEMSDRGTTINRWVLPYRRALWPDAPPLPHDQR